MTDTAQRTGATSRAGIGADVLAGLNGGRIAAATLAECLAVDHAALMRAVLPDIPDEAMGDLAAAGGAGITRRMGLAADLLLDRFGPARADGLAGHASDTVRGWAAYMIARADGLTLAERLHRLRALADDAHFGVREWAWLAVRPAIVADPRAAIALLTSWTLDASPRVRRFAVESTRPRGVWSAHIALLKVDPAAGLPLLEPLRADPEAYVQDSVANWLNDAAKDLPDWVRALCARWQVESPSPASARICRRAMRSLG